MKKVNLLFFIASFFTTASVFAQGSSIDFNGISITLSTNGSSSINLMTVTDRTFECWFQPDDVSSTIKQVIYEEGGQSNGFNIYIESDTLYCGIWSTLDSMDDGMYLKTAAISSGQWYHVAVSLTGATATQQADIFKGYLDGVQFDSKSATRVPSHSGSVGWGDKNGRTRFHDGISVNSDHYYYDGKIDDFKIWNVGRTEDQIREGMNTQLVGTETDLVLYYDFDDSVAGLGISDKTGAHNGTVADASAMPITTRPTQASTIYTTWNTGNASTDWTSGSNWSNGEFWLAKNSFGRNAANHYDCSNG